MYEIGELIIYGNTGVCKVEEIGPLNMSGIKNSKIYYTLKPIYQDGKIFTPIDTNVFMRSIISYEEVHNLINLIPSINETLIGNKNLREIEEYYKTFLETHNCLDIITLVKLLDEKKENSLADKKKPSQIDEKFRSIAENLINEEFSIVLGIQREEVADYIAKNIDNRI